MSVSLVVVTPRVLTPVPPWLKKLIPFQPDLLLYYWASLDGDISGGTATITHTLPAGLTRRRAFRLGALNLQHSAGAGTAELYLVFAPGGAGSVNFTWGWTVELLAGLSRTRPKGTIIPSSLLALIMQPVDSGIDLVALLPNPGVGGTVDFYSVFLGYPRQ